MRHGRIILLSLPLLALPAFMLQERVKKAGPEDFETIHKVVGEHFRAGNYGKSLKGARKLLTVINEKRTEVILEALPAAPESYKKEPQPKNKNTPAMALAIGASVGSVIQQQYRAPSKNLTLTITADSPLLQMFQMWVSNPALLGPDAELIQYTNHKAVLKKEGNGYSLQIPVDSSMVEAKVRGEDGDFLLKFLNQAALDKLVNALQN